MSLRLILPFLLVSTLSSHAIANDGNSFYCQKRNLGSNFYCKAPEPPKEKPKPIIEPLPPVETPAAPPKHPDVAALEAFQEKLVETRKIAVWNPTKNNVRDYMVMQIKAGSMATDFSSTFGELSWQEPELSHVVNSPVDSAGVTEWKATKRRAVTEHMQSLNDRFGMFYFYSAECAACRVFSPILKNFSEIHGINVQAISMDGGGSAEFPNWKPNNGISVRLGMDGVLTPAVVLFDTHTNTGVPISYGTVSISQLEDRIFILTGKEKKDETKYTGGYYAR